MSRVYFSQSLNRVNFFSKIFRAGALVGLTFTEAFDFSLNELWLILAIVIPSMYGAASVTQDFFEEKLYHKLAHQGPKSFKDPSELEQAIYLIFEYLESDNPIAHAKF